MQQRARRSSLRGKFQAAFPSAAVAWTPRHRPSVRIWQVSNSHFLLRFHSAKLVPSAQRLPARGRAEPTTSCVPYYFHPVDKCLEWDLSITLALPLLMVMSIAKSIDPRVGSGPSRCDLAPWVALPDFPCGASIVHQVRASNTVVRVLVVCCPKPSSAVRGSMASGVI